MIQVGSKIIRKPKYIADIVARYLTNKISKTRAKFGAGMPEGCPCQAL